MDAVSLVPNLHCQLGGVWIKTFSLSPISPSIAQKNSHNFLVSQYLLPRCPIDCLFQYLA